MDGRKFKKYLVGRDKRDVGKGEEKKNGEAEMRGRERNRRFR